MNRSATTSSPLLLFLGAGLLALVLGLILFAFGIRDIQTPPGIPTSQDISATVLSEPVTPPDFHLTYSNGDPFTKLSLQGAWSFLFFGYTYCPDICPTTLALLNEVENQLQQTPLGIKRKYVFISIDPQRDSLEHLGEYVAFFNPLFMSATGPEEELRTLAKPLGIRYQRSPEKRPRGDYLIDHSATILLFNPDGKLQALISPPHDATVIAEDFNKITASAPD